MSTFSGLLGGLPRGYRIAHEVHGDPENGDGHYRIVVTYAGGEVGAMLVRVGENGWEPHAEVLPKHQRKGLGTAMWQYAEKLVGEPLEPGLETTQAGQRLINKLLKEPK